MAMPSQQTSAAQRCGQPWFCQESTKVSGHQAPGKAAGLSDQIIEQSIYQDMHAYFVNMKASKLYISKKEKCTMNNLGDDGERLASTPSAFSALRGLIVPSDFTQWDSRT